MSWAYEVLRGRWSRIYNTYLASDVPVMQGRMSTVLLGTHFEIEHDDWMHDYDGLRWLSWCVMNNTVLVYLVDPCFAESVEATLHEQRIRYQAAEGIYRAGT